MKRLLTIATIAMVAFTANASYLYWQVTDGNTTAAGNTYNTVSFYANVNGTDYLLQRELTSVKTSDIYDTATYSSGSINWSDASYFVELASYADSSYTALSRNTTVLSYNDLAVSSITGLASEISAAQAKLSNATYGAVPEPTSGLLTLIGMALLGLRRKRA